MSLVTVTGSAGFLGRAVCLELARNGHHVRAVNRSNAIVEEAAEVVTIDDLATTELSPIVAGCDTIVNCAARVHITAREGHADATRLYSLDNIELPLRLANAAKRYGVKQFIQISSAAALASGSEGGELVSDYTIPRPSSPYGLSKLLADQALLELADEDFSVIALRPPAIYGPGVGAWFAMLERFAHKGIPLPLANIGNRRSFAFLDNVASAISSAVDNGLSGAFLMTDSVPISSRQLYSRLLRLHGHSDRVFAFPRFLTNLATRILLGERANSLLGSAAFDGSRFARTFGWKPPIDLDIGLARTVRARAR